MTLGKQIKESRESKNMSQEALAEELGVSRQAVSKWENNSAIPQGTNREMLTQILGLELAVEPATVPRQTTWFSLLGWIVASILLVLFLLSVAVPAAPETQIGPSAPPALKCVTFYDNDQNVVTEEALWYDASKIDSILLQWEGGTPDHIKLLSTPSGSETLEMTQLLLTKSVSDGDSATLLSADVLKDLFSSHIYFELYFGDDTILSSETYNIFNTELISD